MASSRLELPTGNRTEAMQPMSGIGSLLQGPLVGESRLDAPRNRKGNNMSSSTLATPKATPGFDVNAHFRSVMNQLGLSPEDTGGTITFVGEDPIFPSVHRLGACIGIPIMAGAAGIANIWRQRSGRGQDLTLDLRKAAMLFMSLGTFDKNAPAPTGEQHQILVPDSITAQTPYGELVRLAPPVKFSETKPYWEDPVLVVRGSSN